MRQAQGPMQLHWLPQVYASPEGNPHWSCLLSHPALVERPERAQVMVHVACENGR